MALDAAIIDITARLRQGRFPNEQAISQGIVLRILQELGWDPYDTAVVWPEYQTGEGRVDFALCHPPSKPSIFVEVKQPGKAEDGVRQALDYAFHCGAPFVVLTDGKTWSFFLPAEKGSYDERRVYKLDLFERPASEASEILLRYLERPRVASGEALETARKEYRSQSRRSQARATLPEAWQELVEKGEEMLVELVSTAVESKAGFRPDVEDVAEFLATLRPIAGEQRLTPPASARRPGGVHQGNPAHPPEQAPPFRIESEPSRKGSLVLQGRKYSYNSAKEAMVTVLRVLAEADRRFLERCAAHPDAQGRKRRYIARSADDLYPDRPDLRDQHEELPGGWFVATNLNNNLKRTVIRVAAEVAGLTLGKELSVEF